MKDRGHIEDEALRDRLRGLRLDDPGMGKFKASLHLRLAAAGSPRPLPVWRRLLFSLENQRRFLWPVAGVVAGVAAFGLFGLTHPATIPSPKGEPPRLATRLPATKVALVRLNMSAEVAVDNARIRVSLPPELSFWADGRQLPQRAFEWSQPLASGDNEIPIAVRGQRPGRYRIAVLAQIGEQRIEDEVLLEVVD